MDTKDLKKKIKKTTIQVVDFTRRNWKGILAFIGVAGLAIWSFSSNDNVGESIDFAPSPDEDDNEDGYSNRYDYSNRWFKSATDSELDTEREKVRVTYASAGTNNLSIDEADKLYMLLKKFDDEMSDRAWGGSTDYGYPKHREHGWYLSNDD